MDQQGSSQRFPVSLHLGYTFHGLNATFSPCCRELPSAGGQQPAVTGPVAHHTTSRSSVPVSGLWQWSVCANSQRRGSWCHGMLVCGGTALGITVLPSSLVEVFGLIAFSAASCSCVAVSGWRAGVHSQGGRALSPQWPRHRPHGSWVCGAPGASRLHGPLEHRGCCRGLEVPREGGKGLKAVWKEDCGGSGRSLRPSAR